jgi:hypothetical protein
MTTGAMKRSPWTTPKRLWPASTVSSDWLWISGRLQMPTFVRMQSATVLCRRSSRCWGHSARGFRVYLLVETFRIEERGYALSHALQPHKNQGHLAARA